MGKLAKAITAGDTRRRVLLTPSPMIRVDEGFTELGPNGCMGTVYRVGVSLSTQVVVRDDRHSIDMPRAIQSAKEKILYEVFGEFVEKIIDIRHALYNYDWDTAQKKLGQLQDAMFDKGEDYGTQHID